LPLKNGVERI